MTESFRSSHKLESQDDNRTVFFCYNKLMDKVKNLLDTIRYMTISSVDSEGNPWAAPVWYAYDDRTLYYWSSIHSQHQQNITLDPNVYITIFDSSAAEGEGFGVYARVTVVEVDQEHLESALEIYNSKAKVFKLKSSDCSAPAPSRLYGVKLGDIYVNDGDSSSGYWEDFRRLI